MQYSGMRWSCPIWLVLLVVLSLSVSTPARAEVDLAGRWDSDSLRDNRIGYFMELSPVPGSSDAYIGTLRFAYRDGRRGSVTPIRIARAGDSLRITARRGSFDRTSGVLTAALDSDGPSITLTNCRSRLRLVMARDLDSDCTFRPAASR